MADGVEFSTENKQKFSLQILASEDDIKTNQTYAESDQGPTCNSEELRRSVRCHKLKRSFTPEPTDRSQSTSGKTSLAPKYQRKGKTNKLSHSTATGPDRLYDRLPNGKPFSCDLCGSPFVCNPLTKRASKFKRSRHMPSPRQKVDPISGKVLVLCNACGLAFDQPRVRKEKVAPPLEKKEEYLKSARLFASALCDRLKEPEAERLYCPSFKVKPCSCLQSCIMADGNDENSEKRAMELVNLAKEARRLSSLKCYSLDDKDDDKKTKKSKNIGLGNGQKRSKEFEDFVMSKRSYLRNTMKLCERATQKVLIYSNNFLHKKLKTEERSCRAVRVKGKAAMGMLKPLCELAKDRCCVDNCVMMVFSHKRLLQHWRDSARLGQLEARRVLAEMLTPSGGARTNCYKFISWVTGCSNSTISKVSDQMKRTGGEREPPLHGMKKYWKTKQRKSQECQTHENTENTQSSTTTQQMTQVHQQQIITSATGDTAQTGVKIVTVTQFEQQLLQLQQQLVEHQIQLQQQQRLVQQQLLQQALLQNLAHAEKSQNLKVAQQILNQLSQLQSVQQPIQMSIPQNTLGGITLQQNTPVGMLVPKNAPEIIPIQQNTPAGISIQQNPLAGVPFQQNMPAGVPIQQNMPAGVPIQQNMPAGVPIQQSTSETMSVQQKTPREKLVQKNTPEGMVQIQLPTGVQVQMPNLQTTSTTQQLQLLQIQSDQVLTPATQFQLQFGHQDKTTDHTIQQKQHKVLEQPVKTVSAALSRTVHNSIEEPVKFLSQLHTSVSERTVAHPGVGNHLGNIENANIQHIDMDLLHSKPQENMKAPNQITSEAKLVTQNEIQDVDHAKSISNLNMRETYISRESQMQAQQNMKNAKFAEQDEHQQNQQAELLWQTILQDSLEDRHNNLTEHAVSQTKSNSEFLQVRKSTENMFSSEQLTQPQSNHRLFENLSTKPKILLTGTEKSPSIDQILGRQYNISNDEPKQYISHKQLRYQKLRQLDQWKHQRSKVVANSANDDPKSNKLHTDLTWNKSVEKQNERLVHAQNFKTQKDIPGSAVTGLRKIAPRTETSTPVAFQLMQLESMQVATSESELLNIQSNANNTQLSYTADGIQELTQGSEPSRNIIPIPLSQSLQHLSPVKSVNGGQVGSIHIYNMPIQPFQSGHTTNEYHNGDGSQILVRPADDSNSPLTTRDMTVTMPGLNITLMSQGGAQQARDTTVLESTDSRQMLLPMQSGVVSNMNYAAHVPDDAIDKIPTLPNSSLNLIPMPCANSSLVYTTPDSERYHGLPVLSNMSESSTISNVVPSTMSTMDNPSTNSEAQTITIDGLSLSPEILQSLAQGYTVTLQSGDKQMSLMKR